MAAISGARRRPLVSTAALAAAALGIEWLRVALERLPGLEVVALAGGGLALGLLALRTPPPELGIGADHLAGRLLGMLALTAVLLLPAAVRWNGGPPLAPSLATAAVMVSAGEELAFRGALYASLLRAGGPAAAIAGSTAAFTLAHILSHPPQFLVTVAAMGLLLALWRWATGDLLAPIGAHVLADLSL